MKIVIVDYGIGNVQSITNILLRFSDVEVALSDDEQEILSADAIILPGVGAFKKAMEELQKRDLPRKLTKFVETNKPFLGICLGMQLLFEQSEEFGKTDGLGIIKGTVERFPQSLTDKIPQVGWNTIKKQNIVWKDTLFDKITESDNFYFVHSYICKPLNEKTVLSTTEYGGLEFCSSILSNNIYATQFHPEKSAQKGLQVIRSFIKTIKGD
jgi:imidazole glycerol-phosphate synthase subunit HisH